MTDQVGPDPREEEPDASADSPSIAVPDFPDASDLKSSVRFAVTYRVAGSKIQTSSADGRLLGRLIVRLSELSASLVNGGSNLSIAAQRVPVRLDNLAWGHSVDLQFSVSSDPSLFNDEDDQTMDLAAARLAGIAGADGESIAEAIADAGGAVLTSWKHTISLLAAEDCDLSLALRNSAGENVSAILGARTARRQFAALTETETASRTIASVTGVLDALNDRRDTFEMTSPKSIRIASQGLQDSWNAAIGTRRTLEGELTAEARLQARTMNAWSKLVDATLEITTLKTSAGTQETEIVLLSIDGVHEQIID